MPAHHYYLVDFDPPGLRVAVLAGTSLLEAARRAGVKLSASCGSQASCGQCKITIVDGHVSDVTKAELENLTVTELQNHHRLACCVRIFSAVKVQIPERADPNRLIE